MRTVRKGTALIIYSVGENQTDDGGVLVHKSSLHGPDLGFILHDPEARRRPGPPFVFPEHIATQLKKIDTSGIEK